MFGERIESQKKEENVEWLKEERRKNKQLSVRSKSEGSDRDMCKC